MAELKVGVALETNRGLMIRVIETRTFFVIFKTKKNFIWRGFTTR